MPAADKFDLRCHKDFPMPLAAAKEMLQTALGHARFDTVTFGTDTPTVSALRTTTTPGVIKRQESLQLIVKWQAASPPHVRFIWDVFDNSPGKRGAYNDQVAREFQRSLQYAYDLLAPPPPPVSLVRPGQPFDGRISAATRDYSECATSEEVADLNKGTLPLGVHAFGDDPEGPPIFSSAAPPVWYGKPLFLGHYRTGKPMLYNGVLICAPQNSGKTVLIKGWAKAANRAGYNILLVDVKGNLHQDLRQAGWRGRLYVLSTDPEDTRSDRINFLAGYISQEHGITASATDRIKQLATALLPSEGWTGQGGEGEFFYRNRVIWLNAFIHILLLDQIYHKWKFKNCCGIGPACRTHGEKKGRNICALQICARTCDLSDLYELVTDEKLLYRTIRQIRIAEELARGKECRPIDPGIEYWMRELALLIDRAEFPEQGNRPAKESYQQFTAGLKQALEPFARHGTLNRRICDEGPGQLFRLEDLGADNGPEPVTIIVAARQQDHVNAETVLALTMARLQQLLFDRMPIENPRPIILLLDETRRIRGFKANEYITFAREAKAGCILAYQSLDQMGEERQISEILENVGTQIYLGSLVGNTAKYFMDILPQRYRTKIEQSIQTSASGLNKTEQISMELLPMLNSGELFRLPGGRKPALVYINDQPRRKPILVDLYDPEVAKPRPKRAAAPEKK